MKLKNKKRLIILLPLLLVILLAFGAFKGYQSFCYDQHQTAMDMDSMMKLFNMQLQTPNGKIFGIWSEEQEYQVLHDDPLNIGVFVKYLFKNVTFQKIEYKDVEPKWSLLPTEKDPSKPSKLSTAECLKNFNENLLYNPEYEQHRRDAEFSRPVTMEDLLNNTREIVKLEQYLFSLAHGFSLDDLTDCPCSTQYLPK